jgi:hypothetical protein
MKANAVAFAGSFIVLLPLAVSAVHAEGPFATSTPQIAASSSANEASASDAALARAASGKSVDGQLTAETHRQLVSAAASSLLQIADLEAPESGLGERLRIVAHALADSEPAATNAMEQIAYRSSIDSFFGGNAKDSRLLQTAADQVGGYIGELQNIGAQMSGIDRPALDTQVAALEEDQAILAEFIKAHR